MAFFVGLQNADANENHWPIVKHYKLIHKFHYSDNFSNE